MSVSNTLIILLYIQYLLNNSNALFNCSAPYQCSSQLFRCSDSNDECKLYCGDISSCQGVTFSCNTQKSCDMICDGTNACQNAQFYAISQSGTSLECNGVDSCTQMTMTSNSNGITYIKCNQQRSCNLFSISMDGGYIECGDPTGSCSNLQYSVYGSSITDRAILKCVGSNAGCSNVQFHCNFTQGICSTNCSTPTACYSSAIYCYDNICSSNDYISFPVIGGQQQSSSILQHYVYIDNATDWYSAQKHCKQVYGSSLATITTTVDIHNINTYSNMSKNRWIGLNNLYQDGWQWIDGSSCNYVGNNTGIDGLCEDDNNWANGQPLDINGTCGVMIAANNGMYSNLNCNNTYSFLCNIAPKIDYICARDQNSVLKRVFEHAAYDEYVSNRTIWGQSILTLSVVNNYWDLRDGNNNIFGACKINGEQLILPTECSNWQWMSIYSKQWMSINSSLSDIIDLTFSECHFTDICVGGSLNASKLASPFNTIVGQYGFEYFDMEQNGPVYYSTDNELYLYPIIYESNDNMSSRMYISDYQLSDNKVPDIHNVSAYCDTDENTSNYVFDIRDCDNNWATDGKTESLIVTTNCNSNIKTPYPTNASALIRDVNYMRYYCYYSAMDVFQETDFNFILFAETFRNASLNAFYDLYTPIYDGYIADFEVCDVFVDYSNTSTIISTLNMDNCPFKLPDDRSDHEAPYYAAANFKIHAIQNDLISFGDEVIKIFEGDDFFSLVNTYIMRVWSNLSFEVSTEQIYVFNRNDTTTPPPITTTATITESTSSTLQITGLIFQCLYTLSNSEPWQLTKLQLFAEYLQNATLTAMDKQFTSTNGDVINFQICAIFNDKLVNGADSSCPYDTGSAVNSQFSAVALFQIEYKESSSFKSNIKSKFEGASFKNTLTVNMNNLLSSSTSRRLLANDFAVIDINIIDANIVSTSLPIESSTDNADYVILDNLFQIAFIIIIAVFSILIVLAIIYANYIYINHFFSVSALFTVAVHIMDMLSDVFFTINVSFGGKDNLKILIIFILSGCFILFPSITTIFQLYHEMQKHWLKDDRLRSWLSVNTKLLYFVSIITGSSFTAIELFNSNLFNLSTFDMGLTRKELMAYQYKRVYSVVLLENLPQLVLQASYIYVIDGAFGIITATSLTFTIISIIVAVISMVIQKQILFDQDLVMIEFDVTGSMIVAKNDQCRNIIRNLYNHLSTILGLDKGLIEIIRPNNIPNGLRIHINIHIIDEEKDSDIIIDRFENIMNDAIQSKQLQSTFHHCWKLNSMPNITNLSVSTKDSKKKELLNTMYATEMITTHDLSRNKEEGGGVGGVGEEFIEEGDNGNNTTIMVYEDEINELRIGRKVRVNKFQCNGIIRFIGKTDFKKDKLDIIWYGIELEQPKGKNNGTVNNKSYFKCKHKYGTFVQYKSIIPINDDIPIPYKN